MPGLKSFVAACDFLLDHSEDYKTACCDFRWPELDQFNWALDYFDSYAHGNDNVSHDPVRWHVPKAFIVLRPGQEPSADVALDIFRFVRRRLAPYKRIRRLEFSELPKTISGKIRRVQLRDLEPHPPRERRPAEYWEEDFPDLK